MRSVECSPGLPRRPSIPGRWRSHIRRPKAQRGVTDLQGVVPLRADDRDVRGHAGLQFQVGIIDADDGVVGDDVLHRNRRIAHLHDLAVEGAFGKSIYRKIDLLPRFHCPDVRFGHVGVDLHFGEVIGDGKNDRRTQASRDGLPDIDAARDDDSVDRRRDRAMIKIDPRFLQRTFLDRDHRFRLMERGDGLIEFRLGGILFRDQFLGSLRGDARQLEGGARVGQVAFGLRNARLENGGIDLGDHLPRLHRRIEIDEQFLNVTRNLAADLHVDHRVEGYRWL